MANTEIKSYRISGTKIEVRDSGGKLFAEMAPDRKRLRIAQKGRFVELMVNDRGQLVQINK